MSVLEFWHISSSKITPPQPKVIIKDVARLSEKWLYDLNEKQNNPHNYKGCKIKQTGHKFHLSGAPYCNSQVGKILVNAAG